MAEGFHCPTKGEAKIDQTAMGDGARVKNSRYSSIRGARPCKGARQ